MNPVLFSSQSDHWSTPQHVFEGLDQEFHFDFDPCPLMSKGDGRKLIWSGSVFCNPPYSRIGEFLRAGLYWLAEKKCSLIVFLLPARTDTSWFHEFCLNAEEIRFIKGRLKFGKAVNSAPFPSMVVIFREWNIETLPIEAKSP